MQDQAALQDLQEHQDQVEHQLVHQDQVGLDNWLFLLISNFRYYILVQTWIYFHNLVKQVNPQPGIDDEVVCS